MSLLAEYRQTEQTIKELKERLDLLSNDSRLHRDLEFADKLRGLMAEYDKNERGVLSILYPDGNVPGAVRVKEAVTKRTRQLKTYKNPHTNEIIETKGGNHKILKAWKSEFGGDTVESWLVNPN